MPAFAVAAENRQSGIRLLCVADAARLGAAGEFPPAQPVLALFLRGCKQPNLSSVDFGCKISCLLRSGQARDWLLAIEVLPWGRYKLASSRPMLFNSLNINASRSLEGFFSPLIYWAIRL